MSKVIGIDLGTTNSVVAILEGGEPAVIANAFLTGVLSNIEDRYQSRVIWLVPLLGALILMDWIAEHRSAARPPMVASSR